jgi:hypothetical protein
MIEDPFGLLSDLDPFGNFKYSIAEWAKITEVVSGLGHDADALTVGYPEWGFDDRVTMRHALESALGLYHFKLEFVKRYPIRTSRQILDTLVRLERASSQYLNIVRSRDAQLYGHDWDDCRGGAHHIVRQVSLWRQGYADRIGWVRQTSNRPYPGYAAPSDREPADEGWQRHHRDLNLDAENRLIQDHLIVYERALGRRAGTTERGPAAKFLQATIAPALRLTDDQTRNQLRKFSAAK